MMGRRPSSHATHPPTHPIHNKQSLGRLCLPRAGRAQGHQSGGAHGHEILHQGPSSHPTTPSHPTQPTHPPTPPTPPQYFLFFNALNLLDSILPLSHLPFYFLVKLLALLWAFNPKTQGKPTHPPTHPPTQRIESSTSFQPTHQPTHPPNPTHPPHLNLGANFLYTTARPFLLSSLGIEAGTAPTAESSAQQQKKKNTQSKEEKKKTLSEAAASSVTLHIELAARGLEKPEAPERLDTLCQLRVLPPHARKPALDEGQWYKTPTNTVEVGG